MNQFLWKYRYQLTFFGIFTVYFLNMFIDIMEVDAAQYSVISMEMSLTKSFLNVFEHGKDYLDKPPLLFWSTVLSYLIFGISNFSYNVPSVFIAFFGIYSTFRFARLHYTKEIDERRGAVAYKKSPNHRATLLTFPFLMKWSRESQIEYEYIVELK